MIDCLYNYSEHGISGLVFKCCVCEENGAEWNYKGNEYHSSCLIKELYKLLTFAEDCLTETFEDKRPAYRRAEANYEIRQKLLAAFQEWRDRSNGKT